MTKCKNPSCTKEVVSIEGRRPKEFCSVECRTKFHNSKNKKEGAKQGRPKGSKNKSAVTGSVPLPKHFQQIKNVGILEEDGSIRPLTISEQIAPAVHEATLAHHKLIQISNKMPEGLDWRQQLEWKRNNKK